MQKILTTEHTEHAAKKERLKVFNIDYMINGIIKKNRTIAKKIICLLKKK